MSTSSVHDFIGGFFHVIGTTISAKTKSVLLDLAGIPDFDAQDDDEAGEVARQQLAYGPLGLMVNPLPKGTMKDGRTPAQADYYGIRLADGVLPVVGFDPRIDAAFPNGPQKGTVALAGYAGGFHSIDLTNDGNTNIHVLYAPYGGDEPHAHAVILDTTNGNESITQVHGLGHVITLTPAGEILLKSPDGSASIVLKNGSITLYGNTVIAGGATIGSPAGALPAAKAGPLQAWATALELAITNAFGAVTVPGGGPAALSAFNLTAGLRATTITTFPAVNTSIF